MIQYKELAANYIQKLEEEIRQLCPQSEPLFRQLYTLRDKVERGEAIDDMLDPFEALLDAEFFWSDRA